MPKVSVAVKVMVYSPMKYFLAPVSVTSAASTYFSQPAPLRSTEQPEVVRAILVLRGRISPQSEVSRAI